MKNQIVTILITVILVGTVSAQPGVPPVGDAYTLLSGEHTPVIYTGSGEASSSAAYTTQWLPIGYSPNGSVANNNNISRFNPEYFTLGVNISLGSGADTALVSSAYFEIAYDTTSTAFWNGDSSNCFISQNSSTRSDYGIWTFDPLDEDSLGYLYPLRVLQGGYLRLVFSTTTGDDVEIEWTLTGEH